MKSDHSQTRWAIWHTAALSRAKKLTPFKEFMRTSKKSAKVGIDEADIKARLKAHNNAASS